MSTITENSRDNQIDSTLDAVELETDTLPQSKWVSGPINKQIAETLRKELLGCALHCNQMSLSKTLSKEQKETIGKAFGSDPKRLAAAKRLFSAKSEPIKAIHNILRDAKNFWKSLSVPYVSDDKAHQVSRGLRLMRVDQVEIFEGQMRNYQSELSQAVDILQVHLQRLIDESKEELGEELFDIRDYPEDAREKYDLRWSWVAVEPPEQLKQVHPALYRELVARSTEKLGESIDLAKSLFIEELNNHIQHVVERLEGTREIKVRISGTVEKIEPDEEGDAIRVISSEDTVQTIGSDYLLKVKVGDPLIKGETIAVAKSDKPKVFQYTTIKKVLQTLEHFKHMGSIMQCGPEVESVIHQLHSTLTQYSPSSVELDPKKISEALRTSAIGRRSVSNTFAELSSKLDGLMVDRPQRHILAVKPTEEEES